MNSFVKLAEEDKINIALHYANLAFTRKDSANYFDVTKNTVTKCLHYFIENVFITSSMNIEDTGKICRRIMSKAIGNVESKALENGFNPNSLIKNKYKVSLAIREANLEIFLKDIQEAHLSFMEHELTRIEHQISLYFNLCSDEQLTIDIDDLKNQRSRIRRNLGLLD